MKKVLLIGAAVFAVFAMQLAAAPAYLAKSDRLSNQDENQKSIDLLRSELPKVSESNLRAQIYWRLARDTFNIANLGGVRSGSDKQFLPGYEKSKKYADEAIALDPKIGRAYYWKAAAVGKISQIRNLLRAFIKAPEVRDLLFKAGRLDPGDGEVWYVLAQLYSMIPGFPLSFGNTAYAVSLGRKGLDARKQQFADGSEPNVPEDYYIQLAKELARRGWSKQERERRHPEEAKKYASSSDPVEKNFYYEGAVQIPSLSDREEAIGIDRKVVERLNALSKRTPTQENDLRVAQKDLKSWER